MPDLSLVLLAYAPSLDGGVRLDAPPEPGTVVTAPLDVTGDAHALEGVLKVELFVVRGDAVRLVQTFTPPLPVGVGTVPFELRFDPEGLAPGRVTIRVVATTVARGFGAEIPGLVLPAPAKPRPTDTAAPPRPVAVRAARAAPVRAAATAAGAAVRPVLDDSGRAFGATAPVLPYGRYGATAPPPPAPPPATAPTAAESLPDERDGWASVAGGLLLLVTCSHLHRALRSPDPRDA